MSLIFNLLVFIASQVDRLYATIIQQTPIFATFISLLDIDA